ncbi:MAG TPA: PepSY-associated TM helix domain-containing protein [Bacteroidales bacterium]|nr:PepSY-associated TM helix domain-containing protein [Bacteroidales bacterium]
MKLRRLNRATHRDLGYFFFGMAIIYGVSGIALNFREHWDPNYLITQQTHSLTLPDANLEGRDLSLYFLKQIGQEDNYRTQIFSEGNLRIFVQGGHMNVNMNDGTAYLETIRRRPIFYQVNFLHTNTPQKLWTWFSSAFAAGLIILAISGLFVLQGKNGITRRGAWITTVGIIIPVVLLFLYFNG